MARVAFLLPPSEIMHQRLAWRFIRHLADSHHEIKVISAKKNPPIDEFSHARIQFAQPISHWNVLELPNLIRSLWDFQPEIIHLLIDEKLSRFSILNTALPVLKGLWRTPVVASIFGGDPPEGNWQRDCDILTSPGLVVASGAHAQNINYSVEYAPLPLPAISNRSPKVGPQSPSTQLLLPALPSAPRERQILFRNLILGLVSAPQFEVTIGASWADLSLSERRDLRENLMTADLSNRVRLIGSLDEGRMTEHIQRSDVILLSALDHKSVLFNLVLTLGLANRTPMQISHVQRAAHQQLGQWPEPLIFDVNTWPAGIRTLSKRQLQLIFDIEVENIREERQHDLVANQISRAYSRLLAASAR